MTMNEHEQPSDSPKLKDHPPPLHQRRTEKTMMSLESSTPCKRITSPRRDPSLIGTGGKWHFATTLTLPDAGRKKTGNRLQHASHMKTVLEA